MKKIFLFLLGSMLIYSSCKEKTEMFHVCGQIESADNKTLYFEAVTLDGIKALDSIKLDEEGLFQFEGNRPSNPEFYRLRIEQQIINIAIDSTESLEIKGSMPDMANDYTIEGSENCKIIREISLKQNKLQKKINQTATNSKLTFGEQERIIDLSVREFKEDLKNNYILKDPSSSYAYFAVFQALGSRLIFNPVNDETDVKFIAAVATAWDNLYNGTERATNLYNIAMQGMKNTVRSRQEIRLPDNIKETGFIDIGLPDINGNIKNLSSISNKVIMLDFTAYSSDNSQERILELRDLYNKYSSQGFEIYQISIDPNVHYWKTVSEKLPWVCVHEKEGINSDYISLYQVRRLPTFFIINKDGDLVSRSENIIDIEKTIKELL